MAETESIKKLKIAELRKELTDRGLSSKGNKAELVERLTDFLEVAGADAVLDHEGDADAVLTAEDEAEDLLAHDEELDGAETEVTRKVAVELEGEELEGEEKEEEKTAEPVKKVIAPVTMPISDDQKKVLRAQKFGVPARLSDADKKKARAERFGMPTAGPQVKAAPQSKGISMSIDPDKLKQRAERFGQSVSPTAVKNEDAERIRKRKERFGAASGETPTSKAKISGDDDAEAKKRKRAERFGMA